MKLTRIVEIRVNLNSVYLIFVSVNFRVVN